jgi:hypothetical protein
MAFADLIDDPVTHSAGLGGCQSGSCTPLRSAVTSFALAAAKPHVIPFVTSASKWKSRAWCLHTKLLTNLSIDSKFFSRFYYVQSTCRRAIDPITSIIMRLTTWNVNGIRNPFSYHPWSITKTFPAMFDILEADIIVMQELKIQRKDLRDDMVILDGWDCYFSLPRQKKGLLITLVHIWNYFSYVCLRLFRRRYLCSQRHLLSHPSRRRYPWSLDATKLNNPISQSTRFSANRWISL